MIWFLIAFALSVVLVRLINESHIAYDRKIAERRAADPSYKPREPSSHNARRIQRAGEW